MFDSALCKRPFTQFPLFSSWGQFDWLKLPLLAGLLLLGFFGVRWITRQARWRYRFSKLQGTLLVAGLTATLLFLLAVADRGLVLFLPKNTGTAGAIVVLGRGTEFGIPRVKAAADLWQAKRAPLIFVTGVGDTPRMLPLLEAQGVPKRLLDGEACSLTTPENALFTAAILQPQGIQRILLVTDGPHMWRSLLEFRAQGFTVIPHVSPMPNLSFMDKTFLTLREYLFLMTSSLDALVHGQRSSNLKSPEHQQLVELARQYAQQRR
jgi:uncharacterized SAM-binding protein YcdF (DUF218 family)